MTEEHDTLAGCEFWHFKNVQGCVSMGTPVISGRGKRLYCTAPSMEEGRGYIPGHMRKARIRAEVHGCGAIRA